MKCPHPTFATEARIGRLLANEGDTEPVGFTVDLRVKCTRCGEPFQFIGMQAGSSPMAPMVSIDGQEARLPIAPAGSTPSPLDVIHAAVSTRQ